MRSLFLLRWSARDLRRRWPQVAAIALIIAVGTGVYSALGSTATWRRVSNDASFDALAMYDLRVKVAEGVSAPQASMLATLDNLPDRSIIGRAEERLVVPTQVDASKPGKTVLVPGRVIGADLGGHGPRINKLWVAPNEGRGLTRADAGADTVVLERNFASYYDLPRSGAVRVAGTPVRYVGHGRSPEYFFVVTEEGGFFAQANFAAVFTSLETAQQLTGLPGRVNDLLIRLRPGVDAGRARAQIEQVFEGSGLAITVMERRDEDAYRVLYDDINSDQKFWNVFAGLILLGAAFGAFNLASRMVEAQRREIGIGMALGMRRRDLMTRPMLVGVEIAVLGVLFGIVVGSVAAAALRPVFTGMLPLPIWHTALQRRVFAQGAVLGFALPVAATAWPVWRALRVLPVDAISTAHRSGRSGLAPLLRRLSWPRSTYARMPVGNVLRTPRRTLLTGLGVAAAVMALLSTLGMIDSFVDALDRNDREVLQDHPDRLSVGLQGFHAPQSSEIDGIRALPSIGAVEPVLRVGGKLSTSSRASIDVVVDVTGLGSDVWSPTMARGALPRDRSGIIVSQEAASDLGLSIGSVITLEHPAYKAGVLEMVGTPVVIAAFHPSPFRFNAYMDRSQLQFLGLPDVANQLYVLPRGAATPQDVQRALFGRPSVASAQPVRASSQVVKDSLEEFVAVFRVLELFILLLALLIAYNAASINIDERRREHATLFAFGLPLRRVLRMEIVEGVLIGMFGTAVGLVGGMILLRWITSELVGSTMPDIGLDVAISSRTLAVALFLGIVAVATAPLFAVRRIRRMDVPSTLRVVE